MPMKIVTELSGRQYTYQMEHIVPVKLSERALPHKKTSSGCEGQPVSEHLPESVIWVDRQTDGHKNSVTAIPIGTYVQRVTLKFR